MSAIFISHSSTDNAEALKFKTWLEAQGHTSLFVDFDQKAGIAAGSLWEQALYKHLRQCQAVIALLTPNWLGSKWCFAEVTLAREKGKTIFPMKVQPCDTRGVLPDIQHIDLTTNEAEGYRRLQSGLLQQGLDPQDVSSWNPNRPIYPGLLAFQEEDAAVFFGRGEETVTVIETLNSLRRQGSGGARFALLLGASGSGKSSLARAAVIPRLKKKASEWVVVSPFRPQSEPLDELAISLAAAFGSYNRSYDWRTMRRDLHAAAEKRPVDGRALQDLARDLLVAANQPEATVLLTIDQAEELFGYSASEASTRFLRLFRAALEAPDGRIMAIATLRSDVLAEFQNHTALEDGAYSHQLRYHVIPVDPMPLRSFRATIEGPAQLAGLALGPGLVDTMVQDAGTSDSLPLLAFTLRRLLERYGHDNELTVQEYESSGRLEGSVREEAQRVVVEANPSPEELEALRHAFVPNMVRLTGEGGYTRRRALFSEMPAQAVPLLRRLVNARLVVTDRDSQGRETVEVAHEALFRTWPLLVGWLAADRDRLRMLDTAQRNAEEWAEGGRREDLLVHRDARLKETEELLQDPRFGVADSDIVRSYLDACRQSQSQRETAERDDRERKLQDAITIAAEQKKVAHAQRRIAQRTGIGLVAVAAVAVWAVSQYHGKQQQLQHVIATFENQVRGQDLDLTLSALEALAPLRTPVEIQLLLYTLEEERFTSNEFVARLAVTLDEIARGYPGWQEHAASFRELLTLRLGNILVSWKNLEESPSPQEDDAVNRRVRIAGGKRFRVEGAEKKEHFVTLSSFRIQAHEVTNGEYRRFAPGHEPSAPADLPAVNVTWADAMAYAVWIGGSLPTVSQWEYAAFGEPRRAFPWGKEPGTCDRSNVPECSTGPLPVMIGREKGRTPEGLFDLFGNVAEWCADSGEYFQTELTDPLSPYHPQPGLLGTSFDGDPADWFGRTNGRRKFPGVGFRVAFFATASD